MADVFNTPNSQTNEGFDSVTKHISTPNTTLTPNSVELALSLADMGFYVFPVGPDKKPSQGFKWKDHATSDPHMIQAYWDGAHKGAAVGIITGVRSNLLVLDIDNKNGASGDESLKALEAQHGSLSPTFCVKTPSGGYHYYFRYSGCGLSIDAGVMEGLDYRGEGGYVVAPGSITSGGSYIVHAHNPIAEMPDWLPGVLERRLVSSDAGTTPTSSKFLASGSRNNSLTSVAGLMRRKGREADEIQEYLLAMNAALTDPLPESEVIAIVKSVAKYEPSDVSIYANEQDFADAIAKEWRNKVRYVSGLGFLINEQDVWVRDEEALKVKRMIQDMTVKACLELESIASAAKSKEAADNILKLRKKLKTRAFQNNCLDLVKSHQFLLTRVDDLDQHRNYLGVENGVVNIEGQALVENGEAYLVTRRCNTVYNPQAACPLFDKLLERIFPDKETRAYVLKSFGYVLSGEASLRSFFIWVGSGSNGKSTLLEAVSHVLGDYSVTLDPQSFIRRVGGSGISNDLARLRGARLCVTSETSAGAVLDVPLVKRLSGNDTISARYLHQEFFEFENKAVIIMPSNFVPIFDGADTAFTGRVKIVPFGEIISEDERDPALLSKLKMESSGILNRLLDAYDLYKAEGLIPPAAIVSATEKFCDQSNLIRQFIEECLDMECDEQMSNQMLYYRYAHWAGDLGYKPLSGNVFATSFEAETRRQRKRSHGGMVWEGVKLKNPIPSNPMGV